MWNLNVSHANTEWTANVADLLQATSRNIVIFVSGAFVTWHLFVNLDTPNQLASKTGPVAVAVVFVGVLALGIQPRHFVAANVVWIIGLMAAITLSVNLLQQSANMLLCSVLPLIAVVTVGWPLAVIVEVLIVGLVWALGFVPGMPPIDEATRLTVITGGGLTGLLGWVSTRAFLTASQWALAGFETAREKMEEARDRRMELLRTEEDLLQANRALAGLSDRLAAMNREAEEARRVKEVFVANVSHELRTPLNMIIGFSEMIARAPQVYGTRLPQALLADIAAIQRNSEHLSDLVNDVLDLSQIETERMALSKDWTSLEEIVNAAVVAVEALFQSKGLYLKTELPSEPILLFCDETRIREVVLNLLSNAGRFSERGGATVKAWREETSVVVSVTDTGPGIPVESQTRIFEPFQQLDTSIRRRYGGSGLGLSISKQFVEMHGGSMWLDSQTQVGTVFYFRLPLDSAPLDLPPATTAARWFSPHLQHDARVRRSAAPAPEVLPRFVLLETGNTLFRLFSRYVGGVDVVPVRDVDEAMRELNRLPAQALIVNKPADANDEIISYLKLPYGTPIVACWVPGMDDAAKRLGVRRYLLKPVSREMLLSALDELGGQTKTVLLVDDAVEVLQLFARMLSSADREYSVLRATDGREALGLLRERRPDVMVLDLVMPGSDGFWVLNQKNQDALIRDIPVVVISATDPSGTPIATDKLTIARSGGLSAREFLSCVQVISEILAPGTPPPDRARPTDSPA